MKNSWLLTVALLILFSCKSKRTSLADDQSVTSDEFVEFFPDLRLPFTIADSVLLKKSNDSLLIGYKTFTQLTSDTVLSRHFGSNARPKLYPVGKVPVKKAETYLIIKAITADKKGVYLLAFDKKNVFKASMPLLIRDNDPQTVQTGGMDSRYTIYTNRLVKKADGTSTYRKNAYVYNSEGMYTQILTESNEEASANSAVVNPIDTFTRRHKYAGDYIKDKRNMIAVRDGRNGKGIRFFVHLEKEQGACKGELRGEASFTQPNIAVYRENGDPCVLQFVFTASSVSMKELEGCGNYREIKCFFEGSFPKKKEPKPKKK
jgi:hypothetical protein